MGTKTALQKSDNDYLNVVDYLQRLNKKDENHESILKPAILDDQEVPNLIQYRSTLEKALINITKEKMPFDEKQTTEIGDAIEKTLGMLEKNDMVINGYNILIKNPILKELIELNIFESGLIQKAVEFIKLVKKGV